MSELLLSLVSLWNGFNGERLFSERAENGRVWALLGSGFCPHRAAGPISAAPISAAQ